MTTPIDPTHEPINPYSVAYEAINEAALGIIDHGEAVSTIADAFVPSHHAVYDTRTHVAVPIEDIKRFAQSVANLVYETSGVAVRANARSIGNRLIALLPDRNADGSRKEAAR